MVLKSCSNVPKYLKPLWRKGLNWNKIGTNPEQTFKICSTCERRYKQRGVLMAKTRQGIEVSTQYGVTHCPLCGYNYCPDIKSEVRTHLKYCGAVGLKRHEHSRYMFLTEDEPRGYFYFKCGRCGEGMKIIGVWIDGRERLIINGRCPKCQYWDVRKLGMEKDTRVWIDPKQHFQVPPGSDVKSHPLKKKSGSARVPRKLRLAIIERDNFTCQYCGHHDETMKSLQVDHVVPVSKGGHGESSNLVTACTTCNLKKKDKEVKRVGPLLPDIIIPRRNEKPKPNRNPYANRKHRKLRKSKNKSTVPKCSCYGH